MDRLDLQSRRYLYIWGDIILLGGSEVVRGTFKIRCAHYFCGEIYRMQYNKIFFWILLIGDVFREIIFAAHIARDSKPVHSCVHC